MKGTKMNTKPKARRPRWLAAVVVLALLGGGGFYAATHMGLVGQVGTAAAQTQDAAAASSLPTVAIQSVDVLQTEVSASGNLTLVDERSVALETGGIVEEVLAGVGDQVRAGDVLLRLDTTDLERALAVAGLNVENAKISLQDVQEPASAADIAQAEAALQEAEANLADVKAGPSAEEIAAARSSLAAAQSQYAELTAGPSDAELTQLSADLKKAEIALAEAQSAYDKVAWQGNASSQSADLQAATIDYEAAKAAYEETTAPASNSDLQSAAASIQSSQVTLNDLVNSPTAAEIATAAAQVAEAQASLADLQTGANANAVRAAEITLEQALIDLETAQRDLVAATVTAPVAGVVTSVDAEVGVRKAADSVVFTLTDPQQLELAINVAESDVPNVALDQAATVEIDALPGKTYHGVVAAISPVNDSSASSVSYPVTVRLTDDDLTGVRPGMNAVATLSSEQAVAPNSWLVPTNAIRTQGGASTVTVLRNAQPLAITVTTGAIQGEWTTVASAELQAGDQVVGSLSSSDDSSDAFGPPGGMGGAMPLGGGAPPNGGN
jgi:HlyD family secretion protein